VDERLLTADESAWLDAYHALTRKTLSLLLDPATKKWLATATRPLGRR